MGGAEVAGEGTDRTEVLQIGQTVADAEPPDAEAMPRRARSPRPRSQVRKCTAALASATAAAYPIPEVEPVMKMVRPSRPQERRHEPEAAAGAGRAGIQLLHGEHSRGPFAPHC